MEPGRRARAGATGSSESSLGSDSGGLAVLLLSLSDPVAPAYEPEDPLRRRAGFKAFTVTRQVTRPLLRGPVTHMARRRGACTLLRFQLRWLRVVGLI